MSKNNATNDLPDKYLFPSERDGTATMNTTVRVDDVTLDRLDDLVKASKKVNESEGLSKAKIVNALVYAAWISEQDSNEGDLQ